MTVKKVSRNFFADQILGGENLQPPTYSIKNKILMNELITIKFVFEKKRDIY